MFLFLKNLSALAALVICLMPMLSFAGDTSRNKEIQERFTKCDTNHDGKLTLNEAKGCMPRIYDHFSRIDAQGRGFVTIAEIQAIADR